MTDLVVQAVAVQKLVIAVHPVILTKLPVDAPRLTVDAEAKSAPCATFTMALFSVLHVIVSPSRKRTPEDVGLLLKIHIIVIY